MIGFFTIHIGVKLTLFFLFITTDSVCFYIIYIYTLQTYTPILGESQIPLVFS